VSRWADRDPAAATRLQAARAGLAELAAMHFLPVENLLSPDLVRRLMWTPPEPRDGETVAGVLRAGGGSRVSTENVSKAAWPARPSLRSASAANVVSWCAWSATTSATATLVSTRSSAPLPPAGIAERAYEIVVDLDATRRDDEPTVAFVERFLSEWLDAQAGTVSRHVHRTRAQAYFVAQLLRDYQSTCLVDGCTHASRVPRARLTAVTRLRSWGPQR
jgi:hypothetical protein